MPLLATFLGSVASALAGLFARFMSYGAALRFASYTAWLAVFGTFLTTVYVCMSSLYGMADGLINGSGAAGGAVWFRMLFVGLGMFIPSNAGAVLSCMASVWIGTSIYKIQRDGIHNYSK